MAYIDALTNLKNRDALHFEVKEWFSRPDWSCLNVDLDRFKRFNDYYGLPAGDARLMATARMLQNAVPGGEVYRYSGDEFYCLIEKSLACATELARQIVAEARALPVNWEYGGIIGVPVCVAVAHVPTHATDWIALSDALFPMRSFRCALSDALFPMRSFRRCIKPNSAVTIRFASPLEKKPANFLSGRLVLTLFQRVVASVHQRTAPVGQFDCFCGRVVENSPQIAPRVVAR